MRKEQIVRIEGTDYRATSTGFIVNKWGRPLKGQVCGNYIRYTIRIDRKSVSINASRTIYESFYGKIPDGLEIDHIDGNPRNNRITNLRAVTHQENMNNPITKARLTKPRVRYSIKYAKLD